MMTPLNEFVDARMGAYVAGLTELLAIPSISALPEHAKDLDRCAAWLGTAMRRAGLENVHRLPTRGNPVLYGEWLHAASAPTVLVYAHYDVQPADPLDAWISPPFEPTVRDDRIYARGATDDKGQLFVHLKAIEALFETAGRLPVNIKLLVEGEEEIGGVCTAECVAAHRELLGADVVVISDTAMLDRGAPAICHALRGLVYLQVDVRDTRNDLHSGSFGGTVANPALVLARVVGGLVDAGGRITIPGFYDDVAMPTTGERDTLSRAPFDERAFQRAIGTRALAGEVGFTTLERMWIRPTLDVNGFVSGFIGQGAKTVIPASASAKVSMRIVPNQHPVRIAEQFEAEIRRQIPASMECTVTRLIANAPWVADPDHPLMRASARAMARSFGAPAIFIREGGSNPIVPLLQTALDAPVILFGFGLPDDNAHAPNEKFDLDQLRRGVAAAAYLYEEIAAEGLR